MAYESEIEKLRRRYDEKPEQWFAALADAHRKAGDLEQAIKIVESGIKQRPNYVSGHIVLGRCLVDQGSDDEAEKVFEEVLELDAENIIALKVLGDVAERRGNREAARTWLGRLLEVDPMNDEAREMLERVSLPESPPAITPASPDVPIVTQSAARAAGVASHQGKPEEDDTPSVDAGIEAPPFPTAQEESLAVDSTASLRGKLDAATSPEKSADAPDLLIERASEALPSGEHEMLDSPLFATFAESATNDVSVDLPAPSSEPSSDDERDSSDLAAGTLDFVSHGSGELDDLDEPPGPPLEEKSLAEAVESSADELPLDLELQAEPNSAGTGTHAEEVSDDDLPEDVASIFASAPSIPQLGPSDVAREPDEGDSSDKLATEEWAPALEIDADLLGADARAVAKGGETGVLKPPESASPEPGISPTADKSAVEAGQDGSKTTPEAPPPDMADRRVGQVVDRPDGADIDKSVADVVVDDSIVGSISAPDDQAGTSSTLVTETMAEVYAAQGHFDQARDVYRKLLADSPGDEGLQKRLAALEERAGAAAASRGEDASRRQYAASETGGESVRSMLAGLLTVSPDRPAISGDEEVVFVTPAEPSPLEQAFGESRTPAGEPTRPAPNGPSLASLFGDEPAEVEERETKETTQSGEDSPLTYDGFFGDADSSLSPPEPKESEADDDEEFKAWLQSLKS